MFVNSISKSFFSGSVNNGFTFLSLGDKKVKPIYYIYLLYYWSIVNLGKFKFQPW